MQQKEVFDQFITALETNDMDLLDCVFDPEAKIISSAHGELNGLENIKKGLLWKGEKMDFKKIRIFNNVNRAATDYAYQYCYLLVLIGKEVNDFMNHFNCGFRMTVEYKKKDNDWKITEVRAAMVYECGNSMLVMDQWKLIDYAKWEGCEPIIIDPHRDCPWLKVPVSVLPQTAVEEAAECFWHYNWLIDTDDFDSLLLLTTDNVAQTELGQKNHTDFVRWLQSKREKWVEYHGTKVPKEACWSHISTMHNVEVVGDDYIIADFYRVEPNRLGNKFLHKYNMDALVYTAIWHMGFVKKDGVWLMDKWVYESASIEDLSQGERRYF